jgi:hypothetical protein
MEETEEMEVTEAMEEMEEMFVPFCLPLCGVPPADRNFDREEMEETEETETRERVSQGGISTSRSQISSSERPRRPCSPSTSSRRAQLHFCPSIPILRLAS